MNIQLPATLPQWLTSKSNWIGVINLAVGFIVAYQINPKAGLAVISLRMLDAALHFLTTDAVPMPPAQPGPGQ